MKREGPCAQAQGRGQQNVPEARGAAVTLPLAARCALLAWRPETRDGIMSDFHGPEGRGGDVEGGGVCDGKGDFVYLRSRDFIYFRGSRLRSHRCSKVLVYPFWR